MAVVLAARGPEQILMAMVRRLVGSRSQLGVQDVPTPQSSTGVRGAMGAAAQLDRGINLVVSAASSATGAASEQAESTRQVLGYGR